MYNNVLIHNNHWNTRVGVGLAGRRPVLCEMIGQYCHRSIYHFSWRHHHTNLLSLDAPRCLVFLMQHLPCVAPMLAKREREREEGPIVGPGTARQRGRCPIMFSFSACCLMLSIKHHPILFPSVYFNIKFFCWSIKLFFNILTVWQEREIAGKSRPASISPLAAVQVLPSFTPVSNLYRCGRLTVSLRVVRRSVCTSVCVTIRRYVLVCPSVCVYVCTSVSILYIMNRVTTVLSRPSPAPARLSACMSVVINHMCAVLSAPSAFKTSPQPS